MLIVNETRDHLLADRAELVTQPLRRMKGLLGRSALEPGCAMVIEPCASVHTFFMRFAIDVVFCDRNNRVLVTYERLPPWRLTRIHGAARSVIELPAGTLEGSNTAPGDKLLFLEERQSPTTPKPQP